MTSPELERLVGIRQLKREPCLEVNQRLVADFLHSAFEYGLKPARVQVFCLPSAALESEWVTLGCSTILLRDLASAFSMAGLPGVGVRGWSN
jgi:hypothetical protein